MQSLCVMHNLNFISGYALSQPKSNGWRKTGAWHVPVGTYLAVTGAMGVSGGPADRNPSLCGAGTPNTQITTSCTVVEALHFSHVFEIHK